MTKVVLTCGQNGVFKSCKAQGHAGFAPKGSDIVCAAVTMLLRTAMEVLEQTEGITLETDSTSRGNLAFSVEEKSGSCFTERLICTADFIRNGMRSLETEYPDFVQLREQIE